MISASRKRPTNPVAPVPRRNAKVILLTGATGFVGRFLLAEIMRATDATVYCMVREPSIREAEVRLQETMLAADLWRAPFEERTVVISGDLRLPRLGLAEEIYGEVCQRADAIYHCATSMNHLETYSMARPSNVE